MGSAQERASGPRFSGTGRRRSRRLQKGFSRGSRPRPARSTSRKSTGSRYQGAPSSIRRASQGREIRFSKTIAHGCRWRGRRTKAGWISRTSRLWVIPGCCALCGANWALRLPPSVGCVAVASSIRRFCRGPGVQRPVRSRSKDRHPMLVLGYSSAGRGQLQGHPPACVAHPGQWGPMINACRLGWPSVDREGAPPAL
jgi:hypothetical protein